MQNTSLIIAFFQEIRALKLVLAGLERQSFKDFEVIIADDGTSNEFLPQVKELLIRLPMPVSHIWQEDKGFRKNTILNKAVQSSSTNHLIFIDMDCVPHKEFIREHVENKEDKMFLTGRRVNLSEKITRKLTPEKIRNGYLDSNLMYLILDGIVGGSKDIEKGIYIKSSLLRKFLNKKKRGILGSNFSIHKKDLLDINGFDERYIGPSIGEDSDIQYRLELNGLQINSLNNIAIQYHLYHKQKPISQNNLELFESVKKEQRIYTMYGIKKE